VEIVPGVLVLKEMFNVTDQETLEQLEFNLQWQHALRLTSEQAHLCQKTLPDYQTLQSEVSSAESTTAPCPGFRILYLQLEKNGFIIWPVRENGVVHHLKN